MSFISALDFFVGVDAIICAVVGIFAGWLAGPFMKGGGYGLLGNIMIGLVGAVVGGLIFDWANVMDLGDYLDPLIAGAIGAAVLLAAAGMLRPRARTSRS